jgi:uncharacterized membrane protein YdbT with pleckstrin-like domain
MRWVFKTNVPPVRTAFVVIVIIIIIFIIIHIIFILVSSSHLSQFMETDRKPKQLVDSAAD